MNTSPTQMYVSNLTVETVRKDIKNIHLGVYPPNGRIRVAVPLKTSDESTRLFVISKIPWIKKQQMRFSKQERQTSRKYVAGESHYFFGKRYTLNVIHTDKIAEIKIRKKTHVDLYIRPNTTIKQREKVFEKFYRNELEEIIPKLVEKWQKKVGVTAKEVKIRKMKTKWGTCNDKDKRIWLNLELAKKPFHCINYVFVHELVHLIEKNHSKQFIQLLESALPNWEYIKKELNEGVLSHSTWKCKINN